MAKKIESIVVGDSVYIPSERAMGKVAQVSKPFKADTKKVLYLVGLSRGGTVYVTDNDIEEVVK
jgi:hypothetical protein